MLCPVCPKADIIRILAGIPDIAGKVPEVLCSGMLPGTTHEFMIITPLGTPFDFNTPPQKLAEAAVCIAEVIGKLFDVKVGVHVYKCELVLRELGTGLDRRSVCTRVWGLGVKAHCFIPSSLSIVFARDQGLLVDLISQIAGVFGP